MRIRNELSVKMGTQNKKINDAYQVIYNVINEGFEIQALPEALGSSAVLVNAGNYTRNVICKVVDSMGKLVRSFDSALPVAVVATTVGDGDATVDEATLTFKDGYAYAIVTYTGTFAVDDTVVLTLGDTSKIAGVTVTNATSTDTIVA